MSDAKLTRVTADAEKEIGYLQRQVARLEKRLARQEKIDDMNRHQTKWAMSQLEEARTQAEQANRAKTDFLANMSHEIRTPLNIVLGMGELLAETDLDQNQRQYLQSLCLSGQHLLKLINDILEFSRIESGSVEVDLAPFDLKELLVGVEAMGTHLAHQKGIAFSLEYDTSLEMKRVGDSKKIRQVLLNLLNNGVKFTAKGRVTLSVCRVGKEAEASILFTVSDTGIGIPVNKQELIFKRFSQIEQGRLKSKSGVGLGLAICQRLVSAMGGQLSIDSEVGKGSSFALKLGLPYAEEAKAVGESGSEAEVVDSTISELKVLVVDDIYLNFEVIKEFLKNLPVTLEYADNGCKAKELFADSCYDLILMDIRMPVMGGIEAVGLIRQLESMYNRSPIPIVAMTAHAFLEQEKEYLQAGFDEILIKPFSKADLINVLRCQPERSPVLEQEPNKAANHPETSEGVPESLAHLIPKVIDSIADEIKVIKRALADSNHQTVKQASHAAKGLAGFYGLTQLAEMLENLEQSAEKREYVTSQALAEALVSHISELRVRQPNRYDDLAN